jgi:cyclophilin family peptidyl-prolyl cis-trans isomerase
MTATAAKAADPDNTLVIELSSGGNVVIELLPNIAPKHVARIKELAKAGFYDGIVFHRVIPGFMAQTGDPTGTGMGGSGKGNVMAEFSQMPFIRGTVGAARSQNPNSADSQFFICFADAQFLNGQYTVWGKVIEGMENVDKVAVGEPPANPTKMTKVRLQSDL